MLCKSFFQSVCLLVFLFVSAGSIADANRSSKRVLFLGDSLTDGYGVEREQAFPNLIKQRLDKEGKAMEFVNASISGSTSASALSRLKWQLRKKPDVLFLALGSNDGLRGLKVKDTQKHLSDCIELAQSQGIKVVLAGFKVPPNYGANYFESFEDMFPALQKKYQVPLVPFLLDGVAGNKDLNQSDGIHPNEEGHRIIADLVQPFIVEALLN